MVNIRGLSSRKYIHCLLLVPLWCCFASLAHAQDASAVLNATDSSVVTESGDTQMKRDKEEGPYNGKARKTNQSIAQGLSVSEAAILNDNPWAFSFSTSAARGLDQYADTWETNSTLDLSYNLDSKSALGLSLGYDSILYKYGGQLFKNEDPDPSRYGISDIELSYSLPEVWSDKYNRLVITSAVTFPSSHTSQRASLIADGSVAAALRYRPISRLIITPSVGGYVRGYRYETANINGVTVNSPMGFTYGVSGSYMFTGWLIGALSLGETQRFDYQNHWTVIESISAQVSATVSSNMNLIAGYRWRDQMLTNDSVFDDDKSLIYTGVSYAF